MRKMAKIDGRYKSCESTETSIVVGINSIPYAKQRKLLYKPRSSRFKFNIIYPQTSPSKEYFDSEYGIWIEDAKNYWEQCIVGLRYSDESIILDMSFKFEDSGPGFLAGCGPMVIYMKN